MADTLQCVSWHLRYACPFRQGAPAEQLVPALTATAKPRSINLAEANGDVFGDICLTSTIYFKGDSSPGSGFRISDAVAPVGSLAAAHQTCGTCPANALEDPAKQLAGCCGHLSPDPDDPKLDEALRRAIRDKGLETRFAEAFTRTKPLWYGLWISSPLSREQLDIVRAILPPELSEWREEEVRFLRAAKASLDRGIPLDVQLAAPGHTDLGFLTTFPHCPRCKKGSGERWTERSKKAKACSACGNVYVPADTYKSEPFEVDEKDYVENWLTPAEYAALREEWKRRHAADAPDNAEQLLHRIGADEPQKRSLVARLRSWIGIG